MSWATSRRVHRANADVSQVASLGAHQKISQGRWKSIVLYHLYPFIMYINIYYVYIPIYIVYRYLGQQRWSPQLVVIHHLTSIYHIRIMNGCTPGKTMGSTLGSTLGSTTNQLLGDRSTSLGEGFGFWGNMGSFLSHRGYPYSHHPNFGILPEIKQPFWVHPWLWKPPICMI